MKTIREFNRYPNCRITYSPDFYTPLQAERLFQALKEEISWRHDKVKIFGKAHYQPRLTAFYADNQVPYTYSHLKMTPLPFTKSLQKVKRELENGVGERFTSCLANLYRDGQDSNGWHADDEKELGPNPTIASLSFGATRKFKLRRKDDHRVKFDIDLAAGSLLMMKGETQQSWQHQVPKTQKEVGERLNLTFRLIENT